MVNVLKLVMLFAYITLFVMSHYALHSCSTCLTTDLYKAPTAFIKLILLACGFEATNASDGAM